MGSSISDQIAAFTASTKYNDIPLDIVEYTKLRILDVIGACLAGSYGWEYSDKIVKGFKNISIGSSTIIGHKERLSSPVAAMINTAFGHALELDDGHKNAGVHAGTVVVPTALAMGEILHSSGEEVILSIILGYEFIYRIARNINPIQLTKGFHPSATCGTIGATIVAAKLLGLNEKEISASLGISGLQTAGLMEATLSGRASKGIMVGHAALTGIISAWMSKEGIVGPDSIFEGMYGIFNTMSQDVNNDSVLKGLGERFEIEDTYVKLYPTCRHIHPVIESIIYLKERHKFSEYDIEKIKIGTHKVAFQLTGNVYEPVNSAEAKFSMPFMAAIALTEDTVTMKHLENEFLFKQNIKEISQLIEISIDEEINSFFPKKRGAKVEIYLKDGTKLGKTTFILKGSPESPVGIDVIKDKFLNCASRVLTQEKINQVFDTLVKLETMECVNSLMEILY